MVDPAQEARSWPLKLEIPLGGVCEHCRACHVYGVVMPGVAIITLVPFQHGLDNPADWESDCFRP